MSLSIISNNTNIQTNKDSISGIQEQIQNIEQGVALRDEHNIIRYSGNTDWRIRLEIYSNIPEDNNFLSNENLLFNNKYSLEYVDYIHLLEKTLIDSNILKIDTYTNYHRFDGIYENSLQEETYRHYIYQNYNNRLLLHFSLNILLKQPVNYIPLDRHTNTIYFINQVYNDNQSTYSNLTKGWNTINWFFIHDSNNQQPFILGFNPLLHNSIKDKVELVTGFLENRNNVITNNYNSLQYTIHNLNNENNKYIIKQQSIIPQEYIYSQTFNFYLANIDNNTCNFDIDFSSYNFNNEIKFKSIMFSNNNYPDNNFIFSNLKLSFNNKTLLNDKYYEIIDKYTFTQSHFNNNKNDYIINTDLTNLITFNLEIGTIPLSFDFNINIEFYFEEREPEPESEIDVNTILSFQHKDIVEKELDNKVILMKDGSVGIGTDNTGEYSLYVNNINFDKKGIYCADDITILSDMRYKTNIKTIENPIEKLMALRGVSYNRIDRNINETRYGFIAQEVLEILPEACDGQNGIKNTDILALLVEAVKEMYKNENKNIDIAT